MSTTTPSSEADILRRAFSQSMVGLSAETLSQISFAPEDQDEMARLTAAARQRSLTEEEQAVLHQYEVVNDLLGILRSKARMALNQSG
ncbi:MAG: hypothetical protein RIC55_06510 [Pirellulaceae bacterium]